MLNSERRQLGSTVSIDIFRGLRHISLAKYIGEDAAKSLLYYSGKELGKKLNAKSIEELKEISKKKRLGLISVVDVDPLKIRIDECVTCYGLPECGKTLCDFEAGIIAGALEKILKCKVVAKETHCFGLGNDFCQFDVKLIKR